MKEISKIASAVSASTTLAVDALYKQMIADGMDVIGFGAGEPDFNTPESICIAAKNAIDNGKTRYTPANGIVELRAAVADTYKRDFSLDYSADQIVVASGAKHCIYVALQVLLSDGDEVILPAPYWVTYYEAIKMAGGVPVVIDADAKSNFKITAKQLKSAISGKTKLLILCNPSNPTGMLYDREELSALAEVCIDNDLYIMSDEVYCKFVYDGKKFTSFAQLGETIKDRSIIINGVSKTYAMTGWRVGYSASNTQIAKAMSNYLSHSTNSPSTISQIAAVEALSGSQEFVAEMKSEFEKRRDYVVKRISKIPSLGCTRPDGAFYIMMNIDKLIGKSLGGRIIKNSDDFSIALLESGLVATVSCSGFGCENYIRLTYATSLENIKEGMDRIERFVAGCQ